MKHPLKHRVEYAALRVFAGAAACVPYRIALTLGWGFAALGYVLLRSKRVRTRNRIRQVFDDRTEREVRHIDWIAWRNLIFNAVEMMRASRITLAWIRKRIDVHEVEALLERTPGQGVIYAIPHIGNWELAGLAIARLGVPLMTIVRRQKNLLVDAYLHRLRSETGVESTYLDARPSVRIVHQLRRGKSLGILPDLQAKAHSVSVTFLGHPAQIPSGMATFARKAGVPVVPCYCSRVGWSHHAWHVGEPIHSDPALEEAADQERITRYVMEHFDRIIGENPEQYFWFNKRWVLGEDPPPGGPSPF
jgi:KDO2-lipid IV(A) lauroyltransferase